MNDPSPRTRIRIDEHDLLPGPQGHASVDDWKRQGRAHQGRPHVTVSVVLVPRLLVLVASVLGGDTLERRRDVVVHEAGFELERGEGCCGALHEQCRLPAGYARFSYGGPDLTGQVDDVVDRLNLRSALDRLVAE